MNCHCNQLLNGERIGVHAPSKRFSSRFRRKGAFGLGFRRRSLAALSGLLLLLSAGCLNPEALNAGAGGFYPTAPGDEPFVAIRVINDTTATLDLPILYDDGTNVHQYNITALTPEARDTGVLVGWPVTRVALGDLDDPWLPTITATLADGGVVGLPFGRLPLERNVDYDSGDTIIFSINEDSRNPLFIRVSVGIIDGDAQPATATRADPFEAVRLILVLSGF